MWKNGSKQRTSWCLRCVEDRSCMHTLSVCIVCTWYFIDVGTPTSPFPWKFPCITYVQSPLSIFCSWSSFLFEAARKLFLGVFSHLRVICLIQEEQSLQSFRINLPLRKVSTDQSNSERTLLLLWNQFIYFPQTKPLTCFSFNGKRETQRTQFATANLADPTQPQQMGQTPKDNTQFFCQSQTSVT